MVPGRVLAAAGSALILLVAGVLLLRGGGTLPGRADCTVTVAGRTVELDRKEVERASRTVAAGRSLGASADDRAVTAALTGRARHALTCAYDGSVDSASAKLTASGLTARAVVVRRDVDRVLGRQEVGGFAPGGVRSGHMPGSAHYEGRAVDIFFRPIGPANKVRGWATAQYLVANADRLDISTVIFDGWIWTRQRSDQGWRDYSPDTTGRSRATAAILEHRDHVHVDVAA